MKYIEGIEKVKYCGCVAIKAHTGWNILIDGEEHHIGECSRVAVMDYIDKVRYGCLENEE